MTPGMVPQYFCDDHARRFALLAGMMPPPPLTRR
jgi:hypothetical protein